MPNQYKPVVPIELVEQYIRLFHSQNVLIKKMLPLLSKHYDTETYGLGCVLYSLLTLVTPFEHVLGF